MLIKTHGFNDHTLSYREKIKTTSNLAAFALRRERYKRIKLTSADQRNKDDIDFFRNFHQIYNRDITDNSTDEYSFTLAARISDRVDYFNRLKVHGKIDVSMPKDMYEVLLENTVTH